MIQYKVSFKNPHRQFIDFRVIFPKQADGNLQVQLPAWRPGRYELGDFARLIRKWKVFDETGNPLKYSKLTKDLWEIQADGVEKVVIEYDFYANILNAGSTWLDAQQLYINPVNCFLYNPKNQDNAYEISLNLPKTWTIASGLNCLSPHKLLAENMQQLMDCPIIASETLQEWKYEVDGVTFNIWIQGEVHFDKERFIREHRTFTKTQISVFGDIPCNAYHFMYQFPNFPARHGVEHSNNTVIAWGPAACLAEEINYRELIGISCHELYHTWNIKAIRPKEMMPYDFSRENYNRLGYVAEGVTTYFGDHFLLRSKVFDEEEYLKRLALAIERHLHNAGRFNLSVAESSFDTWLDGYTPGIPGRKVSIYNEGLLIAFITDLEIMASTRGEKSLDNVMKIMYEQFGKTSTGYSEDNYREVVESVAGKKMPKIFDDLIAGTDDYMPHIEKVLEHIGLQIEKQSDSNLFTSDLGFRIDNNQKVVAIYPNSPSDMAGIALGDVELSIDRDAAGNYCFIGRRFEEEFTVNLCPDGQLYYPKIKVSKMIHSNAAQKNAYLEWQRIG